MCPPRYRIGFCFLKGRHHAAAHGVKGVPAFIFIGPDGRIIPSDETSVMTILKALQTREPAGPPAPAHVSIVDEAGLIEALRARPVALPACA